MTGTAYIAGLDHAYLSPRECARYLRVSPNVIYREIATGALPSWRVDGKGMARIDSRDADAWLRAQQSGAYDIIGG